MALHKCLADEWMTGWLKSSSTVWPLHSGLMWGTEMAVHWLIRSCHLLPETVRALRINPTSGPVGPRPSLDPVSISPCQQNSGHNTPLLPSSQTSWPPSTAGSQPSAPPSRLLSQFCSQAFQIQLLCFCSLHLVFLVAVQSLSPVQLFAT